ncbi:MAG: D-alanyl-D-alanine carboxypeptidase [Lachnospiraceae bacterium]|nr:D-alanyl-D-alanine carboxypeptidase [Lachnospiraceae bacterium]
MKRYKMIISLLILVLFFDIHCYAVEEIQKSNEPPSFVGTLYAKSAVLMDGSSGRVLYGKNEKEFLANASTTKILTCILALENGGLRDVVTVSAYAATMPDVQLHIREGEQYYLEDLLYSLMLESHNDVAVAIAEHISGSQEEFSKLMNRKAKEIGCENTIFLTPNGLDATGKIKSQNKIADYTEEKTEQEKSHGTTAADLALIMRYCIKLSPQKEEFIKITQTPSYAFQNIAGNRSFTCRNHNSFFNMMEGVISGKTGFTSKAGYCYVGALEQNGKCYIVTLLACGWPGNKNYKWADCRKLMEYGLKEYELYQLADLEKEYKKELTVEVKDAKRQEMDKQKIIVLKRKENGIKTVLLKPEEKIEVNIKKKELTAPVEEGEEVGEIVYYIQGEKWLEEEMYCDKKIEKIDFKWCVGKILKKMIKC